VLLDSDMCEQLTLAGSVGSNAGVCWGTFVLGMCCCRVNCLHTCSPTTCKGSSIALDTRMLTSPQPAPPRPRSPGSTHPLSHSPFPYPQPPTDSPRRTYKGGKYISPDPNLDWAANLSHMMGYDDPNALELMRLYQTIHSDHEGGNVSAGVLLLAACVVVSYCCAHCGCGCGCSIHSDHEGGNVSAECCCLLCGVVVETAAAVGVEAVAVLCWQASRHCCVRCL
jgi:hypothetical protein